VAEEVSSTSTASSAARRTNGCDVGRDTGAPVSPDYGQRGNEFSGTITGVQLAIAEAAGATDHLVEPEQAIALAMARQ
jgi:arylsulfatase